MNRIKNSFKLKFLVPSIFFLYNFFLIIIYFSIKTKIFFFIPLYIYFICNIYLTSKTVIQINEDNKMIPLFSISNFINHNIYGVAFLFGVFSKKKI